MLALLRLFRSRVPDSESNEQVTALAADERKWSEAHDLFDRVRERNLMAIESGDTIRECQYCFEEVCLQSLYNETDTNTPFDACSPYWVIKNALVLAQAVGVPVIDVVTVVAPIA